MPKFGIPIKFVTLKSERRISQVSFVFFPMTHQRTTDTAQNNIPIPNKKSCKMYENLSILQKNGLLMENQGLGIHMVTKFEQIVLQKIP